MLFYSNTKLEINNINFKYFDSFGQYQKTTKNNLYTFMTNGENTLNDIVFKKPFSLVFGSENSGLDDSYHKIGESIVIPQSSSVDSLNLSIAVGIALYTSAKK